MYHPEQRTCTFEVTGGVKSWLLVGLGESLDPL